MTASAPRIDTQTTSATSGNKPEEILVAEAIGGDGLSFEILIRRYQRLVLTVGCRMTGNISDAEDIAQQTFLKAFLGLSRFQRKCAFSTWLVSIAVNEARMWKRKKSRQREDLHPCVADETEELVQPLEVADSRPDPESISSEKELSGVLFEKITRLNPILRSALEICDLQEESTQATALMLGITVSAVKSRRSRGRAVLRKALAHYHR